MKNESEILDLIRAIYRDVGGAPADLTSVRPLYGGWLNALRYEVLRADNATILLWRADIENVNRRPLTKALRAFVPERRIERNISPVPDARYQLNWRGFSQSGFARGSTMPGPEAKRDNAHTQDESGLGIAGRTPPNPRSRPSTKLLVLCGNCSADREHVVTLAEQSTSRAVVVARCDTCDAVIHVVATGRSQFGRTIADRLKKAISLSAAHRAASRTHGPLKCQHRSK